MQGIDAIYRELTSWRVMSCLSSGAHSGLVLVRAVLHEELNQAVLQPQHAPDAAQASVHLQAPSRP